MFRSSCWLGLVAAGAATAMAQTKLPTADEALEVSAKTGRPVFAMAGQET